VSELRVISPGLLTTVQDLGRWGLQSNGVSVSGAMDPYAHRLANALVGNAADDATLEITMVGPDLECDDERVIAMAGAELEVTIGERPVPMRTAMALPPGSRLKCGRRLRGARAYLAIAGGIDVPRVFGSRATHLSSVMGGLAGRALRAGDVLPLGQRRDRGGHDPSGRGHGERAGRVRRPASGAGDIAGDSTAWWLADLPDGQARVRVLPGPHLDFFVADALDVLQATPYRIDSRSNRMGFRLEGAAIARRGDIEMISDATPMGALQVPASGRPMLLMADRQTTGGYPTIATVITADLGVAGQLAPGDSIWFVVCSPREAMAALIARERALLTVKEPV